MAFTLPRYHAPLEKFCIWTNGFTDDEIDQIHFMSELNPKQPGKTGSENNKADKKIRDSDVVFIEHSQETDWLYQRYGQIIPKVNYDHFLYDIVGFQAFQYTEYKEDQHYDWHMDMAMEWQDNQRKISSVLMLDDPDDYEGGELEVCTGGNLNMTQKIKPKKGELVCFASWMPHRCLPVTSGERRTLVAWIDGPRST